MRAPPGSATLARMDARLDRRCWIAIGGIAVVGLVLRLLGARGGLWLDEAWSATLAQGVDTPAGVFLHINHDNNHHLNSLWLQLVGPGAPPVLQRALSIACGTVAVPVAALIAAPRGRIAAILTAWLFAVSPLLVTLGSEARGYAPMALALLVTIVLVEPPRPPAVALALAALLGTLAQATMVFGLAALGLAALIVAQRSEPGGRSALRTIRRFLPSAVGAAAGLALILVPAWLSPTGMQIGRFDPYGTILQLHALMEAGTFALGLPRETAWLLLAVPLLLVLAPRAGAPNVAFAWLAIVGVPATLALLQVGNTGHPRYYLVGAVALLLLVADMAAAGLHAGGWRRGFAVVALGVMTLGSLWRDADLAINRRGDTGAVVRTLQARAPGGTTVILDRATGSAMLEQAALSAEYRLTLTEDACPPRRFLLLDRFHGENFPRTVLRCRQRYEPIAGGRARGLSGTHWTLYEGRR